MASGAPAEEIMGPPKAISTSCCNCNGPILWHLKHLPKKLWAHLKPLAPAIATGMGPAYGIGSPCRRNYGPIRSHRHQLLQLQRAHPMASRAPAEEVMGPPEAI